MTPAILRSRHCLIKDILSLETQLSDLQKRFDVIVNWIYSDYYELTGLPETVIIAILGHQEQKPTLIDTAENNAIHRVKLSTPVLTQNKEVKKLKTQCVTRKPSLATDDQSEKHQNETSNPIVKVEDLMLMDIESLAHKHGITNLDSLKAALMNIQYNENSALLCEKCNKCFKLKIQLQKHKLSCQFRNVAVNKSGGSQRIRKPKNYNPTERTEANEFVDVVSFPMIPDAENDSCFEHDPLGASDSEEGAVADLSDIDYGNIVPNLLVDIDIKDENFEVKLEEHVDDFPISSYAAAQEVQTNRRRRKCDLRNFQKTEDDFSTLSTANKLTLSVSDFEDTVSSMPPRRLSCAVCNKRFSTTSLVRRHEIEVHMTRENQIMYRNRQKTAQIDTQDVKTKQRRKKYNPRRTGFTKNGTFKCDNCEKCFQNRRVLNYHKYTEHFKIWESNVPKEKDSTHPDNFRNDSKCSIETNISEDKVSSVPEEKSNDPGKESQGTKKERKAYTANKLILSVSDYEDTISSMPPGRLSCAVCNKRFSTTSLVRRHEIEVHMTKQNQIIYRNRHKKPQIDQLKKCSGSFICEQCEKSFIDRRALNQHKRTHLSSAVTVYVEGNKRHGYRCLKCDSLFTQKHKYIKHVVGLCTNDKDDGKEIARNKIQESDSIQEGKEKTKVVIQCEICGIIKASNSALKLHMTVHTGEKDFLCNECGASFARYHTLLNHELAIHKKERNYKCQYCGKAFDLKPVRDNHEKVHIGALKVDCHICGFTFTTKQTLRLHIRGVHENQRPYKCHLCDKSFKTSSARNYHVNTHKNPNGRKRGLNRDVDDMKAAAKRRHCSNFTSNRMSMSLEAWNGSFA